jgi:hypothetical protein
METTTIGTLPRDLSDWKALIRTFAHSTPRLDTAPVTSAEGLNWNPVTGGRSQGTSRPSLPDAPSDVDAFASNAQHFADWRAAARRSAVCADFDSLTEETL